MEIKQSELKKSSKTVLILTGTCFAIAVYCYGQVATKQYQTFEVRQFPLYSDVCSIEEF